MHYEDDRIRIDKFELGSFENNCYVVSDPKSNSAIVVDAPLGAEEIAKHCAGLEVGRIVLTHGHGDHTTGLVELRELLGAPCGCHVGDAAMLPVPPDFLLTDGETLTVGAVALQVLHTPGHTPGGICLVYDPGDGTPRLFSGDTLFPGGPGNTKLPGADFATVIESIETKLFTLPDSTPVYPGHGLDTTIGAERPHLPEWVARGW